jgi:transposase
MIHLPASVRVYLCLTPCDMRKSFDSLQALVREHLELFAFAGHLFVFTSRRRDRVKILYWDRDGFAVWSKYSVPFGTLCAESVGSANAFLKTASWRLTTALRNGPIATSRWATVTGHSLAAMAGMAAARRRRCCGASSLPASVPASGRLPGSGTCSHASRRTPSAGSVSCCPTTGNRRVPLPKLKQFAVMGVSLKLWPR